MIDRLRTLGTNGFALLALMSSFYCLLAYVPFTYYQFLGFPHLAWLTFFERYHHVLLVPFAVAAAAQLWNDESAPFPTPVRRAAAVVLVVGSVALLWRPLLPALRNDTASLVWAFVWLAPIQMLAVNDLSVGWRTARWTAARTAIGRTFVAAGGAALLVGLLYPAVAWARFGSAAWGVDPAGWARLLAASLLLHGVLLGGVFLVLATVQSAAALTSRPVRAELAAAGLLIAAIVYAALRFIVFPGISVSGVPAGLYAAAFAAAGTSYIVGRKLRIRATEHGVGSGIELVLAPLATAPRRTPLLVALLAVPAAAYVLAVRTAMYDWNFIVQKLVVIGVIGCAFASLFGAARARRFERLQPALAAVATLVVTTLFVVARSGTAAAPAADRYAGYDVAFELARDTLEPAGAVADPGFYAFLQAHTNISRAARIDPVEVALAPDPAAATRPAPNVFVIVVDSLRQDYLSPYNAAVDFTPEIDAFADDAIVFRDAFSRYGATGLSQPSIWVGGMLLHQQYTSPFYPMNALDKLLEANNYERYLSVDTILRVIVPRIDEAVNIDAGRPDKDFDLCSSLPSLTDAVDARADPRRPIFAYTQPQNLHISTINRTGGTVLDDADYGDFHAPYASRLRRIDTCFGDFIDHLRVAGLYDESIVALTADHGDSLGEEGRWGHAYTIFPEVIRIPLIVHLPPALAAEHVWDTEALTFSTDITPSLYYLLGLPPATDQPFMGRSLFAAGAAELAAGRQSSYLVASSYGPVYGIIDGDGESLFIADGVNFTDELYDLGEGSAAERRPFDETARQRYRDLIRAAVTSIADFYGFAPASPAASRPATPAQQPPS